MPLNPEIALSTRLPEMRSPIQTLGALSQLREMQQMGEARDLMNEQRRRALEDDQAIRSTLTRYERPDDAIADLYRQGRASAAGTLSKQVFEYRDAQGKSLDQQLKNQDNQLKILTQMGQAVNDESSFQTWKKAATTMLGPEMASHLGQSYDPERVKQALAWGTSRTDYLKQQQDAIANGREAIRIGLQIAGDADTHLKNQQDAAEHWRKFAGGLYSTARNQEEWDGYTNLAKQAGTPDNILLEFGANDPFTPELPKRAATLAMTPKERADVENQKTQQGFERQRLGLEQQRVNIERQRADREAASGGISTAQRAVAERNHQDELEEAERAFKDDLKRNMIPEKPTTPEDSALYNDALARHNANKLRIEDSYRIQMGLPPLLQAEHDAVASGNEGTLSQLRSKYEALMGEKTPLQQMQDLAAEIRKTKDPAKIKALQEKLRPIRERYGRLIGRPMRTAAAQ